MSPHEVWTCPRWMWWCSIRHRRNWPTMCTALDAQHEREGTARRSSSWIQRKSTLSTCWTTKDWSESAKVGVWVTPGIDYMRVHCNPSGCGRRSSSGTCVRWSSTRSVLMRPMSTCPTCSTATRSWSVATRRFGTRRTKVGNSCFGWWYSGTWMH